MRDRAGEVQNGAAFARAATGNGRYHDRPDGTLIAHQIEVTIQPSTVRQDFEKLRADLRQLAETIRLKVHLAGMEAKDAWGALEPKVDAFERKAEAFGTEIAHDIKDAGVELKHALEKLTKVL